MAQQIDLTQIYYEHYQQTELFTFAKRYYNENLTPFFENEPITQIVLKSNADKISVCSWALRQKMTMRIPPKRELTEEVLQEDFDVMSFSKNTPGHDMLGALEVWHNGATAILQRIWSELGLEMPKKPKHPIYQNHFCATKEVYKEYVLDFLIPAMYIMEFDAEIKKLCWQNSNYNVTTLNKPVDFDRIEKFLGVRYIPLHPFILERCFSLWIDSRNLKVTYL